MKDRNGWIIGRVWLVGTALAVLTAGTALSTERPRVDAANLPAERADRAASVPRGIDAERDECTASAGFWGPAEGDDTERGGRRMVCKRYA